MGIELCRLLQEQMEEFPILKQAFALPSVIKDLVFENLSGGEVSLPTVL